MAWCSYKAIKQKTTNKQKTQSLLTNNASVTPKTSMDIHARICEAGSGLTFKVTRAITVHLKGEICGLVQCTA